MEAVLLIGIQGAGKTTFYRERLFGTHVRISLDQLKTRAREAALVETCLRVGQPFAVDNTNVRVDERARVIAAAHAARFRVAGYFFEVSAKDALARNARRTGKAVVPVPGIMGTLKRLQRPTLEEGFDALFLVTPGPEGGFEVTPLPGARASTSG